MNRSTKKTPELVAESQHLRDQGLSYAKIGRILGSHASNIHRWLNPVTASIYLGQQRKYYQAHKEEAAEWTRKYHQDNKEMIAEQRRACRPKRNARRKIQRLTDPQYRLSENLRTRLRSALKGKIKVGSAVRDMDCTPADLVRHIESQFELGMSWENRDEWDIDHIKPLALYDLTDRNQLLRACHYTNLQPLWKADHRIKTTQDTRDIRALIGV